MIFRTKAWESVILDGMFRSAYAYRCSWVQAGRAKHLRGRVVTFDRAGFTQSFFEDLLANFDLSNLIRSCLVMMSTIGPWIGFLSK